MTITTLLLIMVVFTIISSVLVLIVLKKFGAGRKYRSYVLAVLVLVCFMIFCSLSIKIIENGSNSTEKEAEDIVFEL